MNCQAAREALELQFSGEPNAATDAALRAHLEGCASCREFSERLARVDTALERGGLSTQRLEAMEARILARVAPPPHARVSLPPPARRGGWGRLMLAAAAVLAVVVAVPLWRATRDDPFTPRGQPGTTWGVRAFCVGPGAKVTAEALPGGTLSCAPGSMVQFTYTAPRAARLSISLAGSDQRFFPTDAGEAEVAAGTDVALPMSTPVGEWLSGPRQVTARFLDAAGEPIAQSTLSLTPR